MTDALKLSEVIKQLDASVTNAILYFDKLDKNDLPTLLKSFKKFKDDVEALEETFKIVKTQLTNLSYVVIPETMENHTFDSIKAGGYNFILSVRTSANIPVDRREIGHKWLTDNGLGSIILPTVNSKTLSSAIKEYIETEGKIPPADAITIHNQKYIQVRKA